MNRLKHSVIGLVFVCVASPGWGVDGVDSGDEAEPYDLAISVEGDFLSVDVQREPLKLVLEEVGRKTRITFIIPAFAEEVMVSEQFQGLTLEEGVRRLLKGYNYLLEYEKSSLRTTADDTTLGMRVRLLESKVLGTEEIRAIAKTQPRRGPRNQPKMESEDRTTELLDLAEQGNKEQLVTALGNAVQDPERQVREVVLEILQDMEDPPLDLLTQLALRDPSSEMRTEALETLAENHSEAALEALEQAMQDPDADVREQASDLMKGLKGK